MRACERAAAAAAKLRCSWVLFKVVRAALRSTSLLLLAWPDLAREELTELDAGGYGFGHRSIRERTHALRAEARAACEAAFSAQSVAASPYPIILSLEVHADIKRQVSAPARPCIALGAHWLPLIVPLIAVEFFRT